ncbi:MAG: bis(5'-nucleosyl)-tetraphosphatase (symmetrical) YqeK [Cyanobacteria bacterium]|nr:bis(5'-nucleosyl)-tetraphosphatase (symmetrical) YqeK [Cyanobacteriota bacterium]
MAANSCCFNECNLTAQNFDGLPPDICLTRLSKWMKPRVSKERLRHVKGVVLVGMTICVNLKMESFLVELACLLHDACKEMKADQLIAEAKKFDLPLTPEDEANGHVLHGPVAAMVAKHELGITNHDVLSAIAEHTLGAVSMTQVSKVVYLADTLEESRDEDFTVPVWNALGLKPPYETKAFGEPNERALLKSKKVAAVNLDKAIYVASNLVLEHLIAKGKSVHPRALAVRDHFQEVSKGS